MELSSCISTSAPYRLPRMFLARSAGSRSSSSIMPRRRPQYLQREETRHGTVVWYVRKGKGPRTRIDGEYGSPEFMAAYNAAVAGKPAPFVRKQKASGSLAWLLDRYRESSAWGKLSAATKKQRDNIFKGVVDASGSRPFRDVTKADMIEGRERRAATPSQSRNFLDAMRGLFRWALEREHVTVDPTEGVGNIARPKNDGFAVWTEAEVERYEKTWPLGTKERVWLDVLLYTGLRRGDAVRLGPEHVVDGIATITTEKSGYQVEVTIPILPTLQVTLDAGPIGETTFICGGRGKPLTKETFGNDFREACRKAKVEKSAHGLRKMGATRAANAGATVNQLEAMFGWTGGAMASHYTRKADRKRLSLEAMSKMEKPKK